MFRWQKRSFSVHIESACCVIRCEDSDAVGYLRYRKGPSLVNSASMPHPWKTYIYIYIYVWHAQVKRYPKTKHGVTMFHVFSFEGTASMLRYPPSHGEASAHGRMAAELHVDNYYCARCSLWDTYARSCTLASVVSVNARQITACVGGLLYSYNTSKQRNDGTTPTDTIPAFRNWYTYTYPIMFFIRTYLNLEE